MPNQILSSIRAQSDTLITRSVGLFMSQNGSGLNCIDADNISAFDLHVTEPTGTAIYYAFKTDDYWFSLDTSGNAQIFSYSEPDFDTLKAYGNNTAELKRLIDIPAFVGKNVMVCVGLEAADITVARPVLHSIGVLFKATEQQVFSTQYSAVFELGQGSQIASCLADTHTTGEANVEVTVQLTYEDGSLSDWLPIALVNGVKASAIQFKGSYTVANIGSDKAEISHANVIYTDGSTPVTGQIDSELYSLTQDWYMNVAQCRLTVKHSHLETSDILAYVALRNAPTIVKSEVIGTGNGSKQTFQLAHSEGIKYDTIRLYYDNMRVFTGYEVNTEVGRITCEAPEGVIVSVDYEYGWEIETWHKMMLSKREILPDYDQSEYRFAIDDNTKSVCAIRLVLHVENGHTDNYPCGQATGSIQTVKLPYVISDGALTIYADGQELDGKFWEILDDPQYFKFSATEGATITVDYDWCSETPFIYQFAAIFSE